MFSFPSPSPSPSPSSQFDPNLHSSFSPASGVQLSEWKRSSDSLQGYGAPPDDKAAVVALNSVTGIEAETQAKLAKLLGAAFCREVRGRMLTRS